MALLLQHNVCARQALLGFCQALALVAPDKVQKEALA